ncbi:MAG: DUF2177 family protein [Ornithinimicrobium sp.]|uniref:DUF2177 family protein n=1 Tax=Ornithinimicrobium sp. TaxID=1977084 RepID=UPI0026DF7D3D|nr:DUF2177 family protein [Ornithinimicrobium sp.]MDO5741044.1 DUF2177 family protein [Ornithinimicrobium sp.]
MAPTSLTRQRLSPARWGAALAATGVAFGILDGVWLGTVAKETYGGLLGDLMADPINVPAAAAFYLIYTAGVTHFATAPGVAERSVRKAALQGAALGFVAYSTFDLTSLAVLKDYPAGMVPIDIAWGTVASSIAAASATALVNRFGR